MKTITLKNYQLQSLVNSLDYDMPFHNGRIRRRIFDMLKDRIKQLNDGRQEIQLKYCKKDDSLKPIIVEVETPMGLQKKYDFSAEDIQKMSNELNELAQEEFVIEVTEGNRNDLIAVKGMLDASPKELSIVDTNNLVQVLEAFDTGLERPLVKSPIKNTKRKE